VFTTTATNGLVRLGAARAKPTVEPTPPLPPTRDCTRTGKPMKRLLGAQYGKARAPYPLGRGDRFSAARSRQAVSGHPW